MISALVKERFAALLLEIAECEKRAEVTRQVLVDRPEFDAYSAFRRITTEHYGGITLFELKEFFQHHDIQVEAYQLDLLFVHLDSDQDGVVTWAEFLHHIMSKEYHSGCQYGSTVDFNLQLEHSLMRVFEQELNNEVTLEAKRRVLWDTPGLQERALFDLVDIDNNGSLTQEDLHQFLKPYANETYNESKAERIWRRMDEDKDGCVIYDEFVRSLRPIYCYKNYSKSVPQQKEMSPTKIYHKPKGGDRKGLSVSRTSRGNSATNSQRTLQTKSNRIITSTEYDSATGRPLGKSKRVIQDVSNSPQRGKGVTGKSA